MGSRRIPASRQTGERIEELLAGGGDHDVRSDLIRLGVRKLLEEVLEGEVEDRLAGVLRARRRGAPRVSKRLSAWAVEERRGSDRVRGAAGVGLGGAIPIAGARAARRAHRGA